MAELDYGELRAALGVSHNGVRAGTIGKIINFIGALLSLALIAGIVVWGYELMLRDVSGVPVVRALEGPMRVQPEDPGGQLAAHQGLSVNRVQADGIAEPVAERLVLAPNPVTVSEADQAGIISPRRPVPAPRDEVTPMAEAGETLPNTADGPEITAPALLTEEVPAQSLPETITDGDGTIVATAPTDEISETDAAVAAALALADQIAADATKLTEVPEVGNEAKIVVIPVTVAGVSHSPRPVVRPASLNITPAITPVATGNALVTNPDSIVPGTRLVQLGAFDSAEEAQKEWDRLYGQFTAYMEGKSRIIQRAESSGRVFYRLRAMGFDDLPDARRFCSALLVETPTCIPVKVR